jgi:hypothetical protein
VVLLAQPRFYMWYVLLNLGFICGTSCSTSVLYVVRPAQPRFYMWYVLLNPYKTEVEQDVPHIKLRLSRTYHI